MTDETDQVKEPTPESSDNTPEAQSPESEATGDQETSSDLQAEIKQLQDRLLRTQAELENFRRRSQREAQDAHKYKSLDVIRDILPALDNLHRAIEAAEQTGNVENLIEGVRMVASQFEEVLKAHAAERLHPEGQSFDPNVHEALSQVPSAEHEPMTVLQVVQPGYRIHDRVIRPAKVIVSCAHPDSGSEQPAADETSTNSEKQ